MIKFLNSKEYLNTIVLNKKISTDYFNNCNYKIQLDMRCCFTCNYHNCSNDWISYCSHDNCIKIDEVYREVTILSICDNYIKGEEK